MSSEEKAVKNDDRVEALCIECGEWSRIEPTGPYIVPAPCFEPGAEQAAVVDCPKCGAVQFPESECECGVMAGRSKAVKRLHRATGYAAAGVSLKDFVWCCLSGGVGCPALGHGDELAIQGWAVAKGISVPGRAA